jgi:hypothetical protein
MAVATLNLAISAYPNGFDQTHTRTIAFGTASLVGSSPSYVQGGIRANYTPLVQLTMADLLPKWAELVTRSGSGYVYVFNRQGPIITNLALTTNVVTITAKNNLLEGDVVTLSGLTTSTFLNGAKVTVLASPTATAFTFAYTHANVGSAAETGNALPYSYASGLPFQGNIIILQSAGSAAPMAEIATAAMPAGVVADMIRFRSEFLR